MERKDANIWDVSVDLTHRLVYLRPAANVCLVSFADTSLRWDIHDQNCDLTRRSILALRGIKRRNVSRFTRLIATTRSHIKVESGDTVRLNSTSSIRNTYTSPLEALRLKAPSSRVWAVYELPDPCANVPLRAMGGM